MVGSKPQQGTILSLLFMLLSLMGLLVFTMNKLTQAYYGTAVNNEDYLLAKNYAKAALLIAESAVYYFDLQSGMEHTDATGSMAVSRHKILSSQLSRYNLAKAGAICNYAANNAWSGWCYKPRGAVNKYAQSPDFLPWLMESSLVVKPCHSYSPKTGGLPLLDDKTSRFSISYFIGDKRLCAQPRYMLEPISLDYRGNAAGRIVQSNGVAIAINPAQSARIYRITVRAFGRNGDTRVTLQEYLAIYGYANGLPVSWQVIPLAVRFIAAE